MTEGINGMAGFIGRISGGPGQSTMKPGKDIIRDEEKPVEDAFVNSLGSNPLGNTELPVKSRIAASFSTDKNSLICAVDSDSYIGGFDIMAPALPVTAAVGLLPEKPGKSFSKLVNSTDPESPYQCKSSALTDVAGDAHLIKRLDTIPGKLIKGLWKALFTKKDYADREDKDILIGRENPIKVDALLNKMTQIIQEHPEITPTMGSEHTWSNEADKYRTFGFFRRLGGFITGKQGMPAPTLGRTKLFLCLACGWTGQYMPTGNEEKLDKKLMSYKDGSVRLEDLLRESYLINKGDMYKTLMTAENVLATNIYSKDRDKQPLQKKLQYIRNDSKPKGDNFGAWYHFIGAALYGLVRTPFESQFVMRTEALGSYFLEGPDRQETHINITGAKFGSRLQKMMNDNAWKIPLPPGTDTSYMNLGEFKQG